MESSLKMRRVKQMVQLAVIRKIVSEDRFTKNDEDC